MIGLLLGFAVLAAVIAVAVRRGQRKRARLRRPGATMRLPITVSRFDEIDASLDACACHCGGRMVRMGESSRTVRERRFRVVRLVCHECERDEFMHFDVTAAFH